MTTRFLLLAICVALTVPAEAHTSFEGLDAMANGALHPLVTPVHAMILLGLALLLAQRRPRDVKTAIGLVAPAAALGLGLTTVLQEAALPPPLLIGTALAIGAAVALDRRMPPRALLVLCTGGAMGVGLDSGLETGTAFEIGKTLLGTWLAMSAVVLYLALSAANGSDKKWARIAMRVVGSWIVAISLMVLAFSLRNPSAAIRADDQPRAEKGGQD